MSPGRVTAFYLTSLSSATKNTFLIQKSISASTSCISCSNFSAITVISLDLKRWENAVGYK
jgi:hypothetical protein